MNFKLSLVFILKFTFKTIEKTQNIQIVNE